MKKQILSIIFGILLIGIVSANISISPSSIDINVYPGETHQINLTITSDEIYEVYFNSTNPHISITPSSIIINKGATNAVINLTFALDIPSGITNFNIEGNNYGYSSGTKRRTSHGSSNSIFDTTQNNIPAETPITPIATINLNSNSKNKGSFLTGAVTGMEDFIFSSEGIVAELILITTLIGSIVFIKLKRKRNGS